MRLLGQLWPRFAWAVAILAVLGVAVWLVVPVPGRNEQTALLARNAATQGPQQAGEPLRPLPAAPAMLPGQSEDAVPASSSAVAELGMAKSALRSPTSEPELAPKLIGKDSFAAKLDDSAQEKLALAASPQPKDRRKAAEAKDMAFGQPFAPPPAGPGGRTSRQQGEFAATSGSVARAPAAPAPPPPAAEVPTTPTVAFADKPAMLATESSDSLSPARKSPDAIASANRPRPASVATDGLAASTARTLKEGRSPSAVQRFVQVAPGAATKALAEDKAKAAHSVLASFEVEQADHELRITDGDGSVYAGYVQPADAGQRARLAKAEAPAAAQASRATGGALQTSAPASLGLDQSVRHNYFFRVTGTNRTLHKQVVFTGNLIATADSIRLSPADTNLAFGTPLGDVQAGFSRQNLLPLLNSRIAGKVVVGSGKAIEINALPTAP